MVYFDLIDQEAFMELKEMIHESLDPKQVLYRAVVVEKRRPELHEDRGMCISSLLSVCQYLHPVY